MVVKSKTKISILIEKDGKSFVKRLTHRQVSNLYNLKFCGLDIGDIGIHIFAEALDYISEGLAFTSKGKKIVKSNYSIWHSGKRPKWREWKEYAKNK